MRSASLSRNTKETQITCVLEIEGTGKSDISTGIGFFDHMLDLFAFHSNMNLKMIADGDLDVCDHHTIEDCGITLGSVLKQALGDRKGINRYGNFFMPMDETLAQVTLDISGRPYLVFNAEFTRDTVGMMATEMVEEFFRAVAVASGLTLHINVMYGKNDHHKIEAIFKAFGRALKEACLITSDKIPSSKGVLE
ncbi:MAG: imidazoleglycerol-phosphate dehydratase HisB [Firmicutes bacterium]|nr:imidazoleglycerol-phosphate dehydratase HisB [Bacillota bacterium]